MDERSINRIRTARFSHSVRGYDRHEVDQFLDELADWLERTSESGVDAEQARAELARVGEQVASILTEAHDVAQQIRDEASAEARQHLVKANMTAESLRSDAEEYAENTREEADAYGRKARGDADTYAENTREEADRAGTERRESAEREAEAIIDDANKRKREVEEAIADLEQRRDGVVAELQRLASGIAGAATQHRGDADSGGNAGDPAAEAAPEGGPAAAAGEAKQEEANARRTSPKPG